MQNFCKFAAGRRSIRKFDPRPVPAEELEYFIRAAVTAPSGCNSQCWEFVAVTDPAVIGRMSDTVRGAYEAFYAGTDAAPQQIAGKINSATFFRNAPAVIAVFLTHLTYYDARAIEIYRKRGLTHEQIMQEFGCADVLSVGAAVQNLLLAVHERGFGACWMNEPALAASQMNELLGVSPDSRFLSLIPVGYPAYQPRHKEMKPFDEVYHLIG